MDVLDASDALRWWVTSSTGRACEVDIFSGMGVVAMKDGRGGDGGDGDRLHNKYVNERITIEN